MNNSKNTLKAPGEVPLLGQEQIKNIGVIYKRKRRVFMYTVPQMICLLTFVVILSIAGAVLFFKSHNQANDNFDNGTDKTQQAEDCVESTKVTQSSGIVTEDTTQKEAESESSKETLGIETLYSFDYSLVPENYLPIIPMDLSMCSSGETYINNNTGLIVDLETLLSKKIFSRNDYEMLATINQPKVLIIHTHSRESYSEEGALSYSSEIEEIGFSSNDNENVVSIGELMAEVLNDKGIPTVHSSVMHDSIRYKDSYIRSAETITKYLEKYPSIELVIDIHRESLMTSEGALVRPVTLIDSEEVAQVMCVVGSDWGGEKCPNWQDNLSIALKLRDILNSKYGNICRPPQLRESTYNQDLSRYSLTIEVGSSGNSLEEAKRAATIIANGISKIMMDY